MSTKQISFLFLFLLSAQVSCASEPFRVNMAHLLSLIEKVPLHGDTVCVVGIYADYPTYKPVEAKGEGFACVDDAARAAVLFIRYNEVFQKDENEPVINGLVKFLLNMQTENGLFYNFLEKRDGRVVINTDGRTSAAGFGWWAARAVWALGEAADYFKGRNEKTYDEIKNAVGKSLPQIDSLAKNYGKLDKTGNPTWLLYGDGADATSELVLGLNEIYKTTGNSIYSSLVKKLCEGMIVLQRGSCDVGPYGVLASNGGGWHGWANSQATAILQYSRLTRDTSMIRNALREVNCFLPRWAGALFFRSCNMQGSDLNYSGQIAYDVRPAVTAATEAYEITHDQKYKTLACILSSWFFGNNTSKTDFYSEETGICFDGTIDSIGVNKNSGAESTVEALLTMVELHKIDANFDSIVLVSPPSFNANEYTYSVDGKELKIRMTADGFRVN